MYDLSKPHLDFRVFLIEEGTLFCNSFNSFYEKIGNFCQLSIFNIFDANYEEYQCFISQVPNIFVSIK